MRTYEEIATGILHSIHDGVVLDEEVLKERFREVLIFKGEFGDRKFYVGDRYEYEGEFGRRAIGQIRRKYSENIAVMWLPDLSVEAIFSIDRFDKLFKRQEKRLPPYQADVPLNINGQIVAKGLETTSLAAPEKIDFRSVGFTDSAIEFRRNDLALAMFAAFNGVDVEQLTTPMKYFPNASTERAWSRVGDAATQHLQSALLRWAVERWEAEVKNRPLRNVHRRSLDDAWRQVIRHAGGNPDELVGASHDRLVSEKEMKQ